jgi:hypothetical protein
LPLIQGDVFTEVDVKDRSALSSLSLDLIFAQQQFQQRTTGQRDITGTNMVVIIRKKGIFFKLA